jgi:hypothetical protein
MQNSRVVALRLFLVADRVFKESPHPDENQRQQLSKQLGLSPRQVKFWFQNRRTQIKVSHHHNTYMRMKLPFLLLGPVVDLTQIHNQPDERAFFFLEKMD